MRFLRSNTAVLITVGPFYDKTDGVTIETALTITNERITLTADTDAGSAPTNILDNVTGATSGTDNDLNYITGNDAGMMQLELSASNTNRVGRMLLSITDAANHVPVFHELFVLPQAIYDWLTGVIVPLPANVTTWLGAAAATPTVAGVPEVDVTHLLGTAWTAPATAGLPDCNVKQISTDATAADNAEAFFDGTGYAGTGNVIPTVTTLTNLPAITANWLTAAGTAADFTTEIQAGLATAAALDAVDNFIDTEVAAIISTLGTPAGASISADIAAIEAQTDDIGAAGAGLTAVPWNAAWDAEVQSEVVDALEATVADSVPADGTRPSVASGIYMITQLLTDHAISGTTWTVYKPDGTTALYTLTLNSATAPTAATRAT